MAAGTAATDRGPSAPNCSQPIQNRREASQKGSRRHRSPSPESPDRLSTRSRSYSQSSLLSEDGGDMEAYVKALPNKRDFESYIRRFEATYKKEMIELKKDIGTRIDDMEQATSDLAVQVT